MPVINTRQINGVVRTTEPVWSNIERMSEACTAWYTYNTHDGVYSWVINQAGNSVASLSEADIIGPIQISGSGLTNLYNAVEMEYPNAEIRDQPEYFKNVLSPSLRNAYEPDNTLQMTNEFINNQMQAEYVATVTLRQSRLDKTVTINMDYTKINLRAGDIIDITSPTYGWTAKEFRIMRVREIEGDDGSLRLEFSCSEYDDSIYPDAVSEFLPAGTPGIRSLGSIGVPGTPTVTLTTVNSLPAQTVSTTVPEGIVDRVQFWAGNVLITGNVANTDYNLIGTIASTDANAFTTNAVVTFNSTGLKNGTWAWKTRGVNINGTGPYSNVSANVVYDRGQAPDLIIQGTPTVDSSGNAVVAVVDLDWSGSYIADGIYYAANTTYQPVIQTADVYMIGINGNIANVAATIPPGQSSVIVDQTINTVVNKSSVRTITGNATQHTGVAVYASIADWDLAEYTANGFVGLNWSEWVNVSRFKDETEMLTGNVLITTSGLKGFTFDPAGNTKILALGYSATIVPNRDQFASSVDPISGITSVIYTVPFSGNTCITDTSSGNSISQYPGKSGSFVAATSTGFVQAKVRIDK